MRRGRHNRVSHTVAAAAIVLIGTGAAFGDSPLVTTQGIGTRAAAMGNAFVALADDYSATYWNPAGLAFIKSRELQAGLESVAQTTVTDFAENRFESEQQGFRLSSLGWVRSLPTTSGGLAFAFGYSAPAILDNVYRFQGKDVYLDSVPRVGYYTPPDTLRNGDTLEFLASDNAAFGQIRLLTGSVGWQPAPGLGFGVAASVIFGSEEQHFTTHTAQDSELFQNSTETIARRYQGIDLRIGLLYAPNRRIAAGIRLDAPQLIRVREQSIFRDRIYPDFKDETVTSYGLRSSFSGSGGMAFRLPLLTLATQASFRAPVEGSPISSPRGRWKGGVGIGIEMPVPRTPVLLRAGYQRHQLDLHPYAQGFGQVDDEYEPSLRSETADQRISGGLAVLIGDVLAIEASYAYSQWGAGFLNRQWENSVEEKHTAHRVLTSFSFRY